MFSFYNLIYIYLLILFIYFAINAMLLYAMMIQQKLLVIILYTFEK